MKNVARFVPGYVVITIVFLLKAVVCQVTKDHSLSLRSTLDVPYRLLSLSRTYSSSLGRSLTPRSGLALLLCSQLTLNPSSLKNAHSTPTEEGLLSLVPRHSPQDVADCLYHISFGARPLCTRASHVGAYLLSDSPRCLEARHEARIYSPSLHSV